MHLISRNYHILFITTLLLVLFINNTSQAQMLEPPIPQISEISTPGKEITKTPEENNNQKKDSNISTQETSTPAEVNISPTSPNSLLESQSNQKTLDEITQDGKKTVVIDPSNSAFNLTKPSIMLSNDEIKQIEEAIQAMRDKKPLKSAEATKSEATANTVAVSDQPKEESRIYLNAILYISKNNWIVWLNGDKITSKENIPTASIYITSVDNNKAAIKWSMGISKWKVLTGKQDINEGMKINKDNQIELNFTLKSNQTYNLINNKITEGKNKAAPTPPTSAESPPANP